MSYLGIVAGSVLATNALLHYGLGTIPGIKGETSEKGPRGGIRSIATLTLLNALAAAVLWCLRSLTLEKIGLAPLDIFFFALLVVPPLKALSRAATGGGGIIAAIGAEADELIVGSLVFGIALITARSGYTLGEAVAAAAASGFGYWMASALLESIHERLELSDLPRSIKGAPSMLISAALMSMALMGIDAGVFGDLGVAP